MKSELRGSNMRNMKSSLTACKIALCAIACGALFGASAQAEKVRVSIVPLADAAPFYAALKNGDFEAEGLQVEPTTSIGGAIAIPSLVSGAIDVAYNNVVSALLAKAQGLDIKMIAPATRALMQRSGVIARKDEGITGPDKLAGKTVAVNNRNTLMWLYAREWAKQGGADPDSINFREVPFPQMNDALRQKQVDAIYVVDPFQSKVLEEPNALRLANPNEIQPDVVTAVYVASGKFVAKDGGAIADKFLRALGKGNAWYNANINDPKVTELISEFTKINPEVVAKLAKGPALTTLDVESIRKTAKLMVDHKMLTSTDVDGAVYIKK